MQNEFNLTISSIHPITVSLPSLGDTALPAGREIQLLNAPIDVVNYLRSTFTNTGVKVELNKISKSPCLTYDYKILKTDNNSNQIKTVNNETNNETPLQKVSNFELPSGKHKGKKLKEVDDDALRVIARMTKTQAVKSAIEAYLMLK